MSKIERRKGNERIGEEKVWRKLMRKERGYIEKIDKVEKCEEDKGEEIRSKEKKIKKIEIGIGENGEGRIMDELIGWE